MNSNLALSLAPRASSRPVRLAPARKLVRVGALPALRYGVRPALAPSAGARAETVLMGVSFLALAGLAVVMEAVGVAGSLLG
jgi:hypothetical protein